MIKPKVSIIVTTYKESTRRYLDLCIKSIRALNYPSDRLDVVLVARRDYAPEYAGVRTVWPDQQSFHNPVGLNYGFASADSDSDHYLMLNDDTVLTRDSLARMVELAGDSELIMCPISPCDNYWKYVLHFSLQSGLERIALNDRFYRYDDLKEHHDGMINAESAYPQGLLVTDMLCLYAALIPRKVWQKVGEFDEHFLTGQDDYDYCLRARALDIPRVIALNALIWHFGGVTADSTLDPSIREKNIAYFKSKWPGEKL